MNMHFEPATSCRPDLAHRVASSLGLGQAHLNSVDFDDLFVSEAVLKLLQNMADAAVQAVMSTFGSPQFRAYWIEPSMDLVICVSLERNLQILKVPHGHWSLRQGVYH